MVACKRASLGLLSATFHFLSHPRFFLNSWKELEERKRIPDFKCPQEGVGWMDFRTSLPVPGNSAVREQLLMGYLNDIHLTRSRSATITRNGRRWRGMEMPTLSNPGRLLVLRIKVQMGFFLPTSKQRLIWNAIVVANGFASAGGAY